jgi:hypothetical protein
MHSHFIRAVLSQRCLLKILREERVKVTAGARERARGSLSFLSGKQQTNLTEPKIYKFEIKKDWRQHAIL